MVPINNQLEGGRGRPAGLGGRWGPAGRPPRAHPGVTKKIANSYYFLNRSGHIRELHKSSFGELPVYDQIDFQNK